MFTVYCHINKINGKRYVGITSREVKKRWLNGKGYQGNYHFNNAIKKYGWDNFEHQIIAENLTKEDAEKIEIKLIKEWNLQDAKLGYNLADGGNVINDETKKKISKTLQGHKVSNETKQKISMALKNRTVNPKVIDSLVAYRKGRLLSEEHKRKISESEKGKMVNNQTREKLRIAAMGNKNMLGKKHSDEARKKMSENYKGKRKVKNIKSNIVYNSIKEAAEAENVTWGTIYYHCSDKCKIKNKKWQYAKEEEK